MIWSSLSIDIALFSSSWRPNEYCEISLILDYWLCSTFQSQPTNTTSRNVHYFTSCDYIVQNPHSFQHLYVSLSFSCLQPTLKTHHNSGDYKNWIFVLTLTVQCTWIKMLRCTNALVGYLIKYATFVILGRSVHLFVYNREIIKG